MQLSATRVCVILVVLAACGTSVQVDTTSAADPELIEAGAPLYEAHCAECHGSDLRGTDRGPSHLSAVYEPNHHADGSFTLAVTRGSPQHHWNFGPMPPVVGLDQSEIDAIVAYVRDVQAREGFEPYPP